MAIVRTLAMSTTDVVVVLEQCEWREIVIKRAEAFRRQEATKIVPWKRCPASKAVSVERAQ